MVFAGTAWTVCPMLIHPLDVKLAYTTNEHAISNYTYVRPNVYAL